MEVDGPSGDQGGSGDLVLRGPLVGEELRVERRSGSERSDGDNGRSRALGAYFGSTPVGYQVGAAGGSQVGFPLALADEESDTEWRAQSLQQNYAEAWARVEEERRQERTQAEAWRKSLCQAVQEQWATTVTALATQLGQAGNQRLQQELERVNRETQEKWTQLEQQCSREKEEFAQQLREKLSK